jgi:hypothetical protein
MTTHNHTQLDEPEYDCLACNDQGCHGCGGGDFVEPLYTPEEEAAMEEHYAQLQAKEDKLYVYNEEFGLWLHRSDRAPAYCWDTLCEDGDDETRSKIRKYEAEHNLHCRPRGEYPDPDAGCTPGSAEYFIARLKLD